MKMRLRPHAGWLLGALASGLVLVATWKLTLGSRIIARGDLLLYFYPLRDYASAAIRALHLPLWNPYTFMGAPFLANSQVGFFNPFNVLTAWMPVGHAVSWNIAFHLFIAGLGMYALTRSGVRLGAIASFAAAVAFGLGGYLGAQVEHLNQLQVLAWLPWQVLLVLPQPASRLRFWPRTALLALTITLQVLAGHTQSLYICLVTLGIVAVTLFAVQMIRLVRARSPRRDGSADYWTALRAGLKPLGLLLVAGALGALISSVQLAPTLELATQSARSGGLSFNEVGSFSWRPWVVARALLPTYGDPLFPEYVAYLGVSGLALALLGTLGGLKPGTTEDTQANAAGHTGTYRVLSVVLIVCGAILALGIATPLFSILYRLMPGFSLFRAQARWLILFALGGALAVGFGVQALRNGLSRWHKRAWLVCWIALAVVLVTALLLGAKFSPEAEYRGLPAPPVLGGWAVALGLVSLGIVLAQFRWLKPSTVTLGFCTLLSVELLVASQYQPYARAADDGALTDLRPSTAHLLAGELQPEGDPASANSDRVLALSGLFFDPGDLPEQTLIFGPQLSADELYDRIVASKQKEVLSPNLSLYYRLPSVDGYDGGLLPLRNYANFVQQFVPAAVGQTGLSRTADGRLRELLPSVPAAQWLQRMAVGYVIADKTHDVFIDNVYYDLQFTQALSAVSHLPLDPFGATSLGIVLSAPGRAAGASLLNATLADGSGIIGAYQVHATAAVTGTYFGVRLNWEGRRSPSEIVLTPTVSGVTLLGMTSIDAPAGAFQSQPVRGQYDMCLVHSGDVKIYANEHPAPRTFVASADEISMFNGQLRVNTLSDAQATSAAGQVSLLTDEPEEITLAVRAPSSGWLVLRDAYYPGWVARIDGTLADIRTADLMFRAVHVPAGQHSVTFTYEPVSVRLGALLSTAGIVVWLAIVLASGVRLKVVGGSRGRVRPLA